MVSPWLTEIGGRLTKDSQDAHPSRNYTTPLAIFAGYHYGSSNVYQHVEYRLAGETRFEPQFMLRTVHPVRQGTSRNAKFLAIPIRDHNECSILQQAI